MLKFPDAVHHHDWWILLAIAAATAWATSALGFSGTNSAAFIYLIPTAAALIPAALAHARGTSLGQVTIITFMAWLICASMVLGYGCYAFAALNFPLQDDNLLAFDTALGIDLVALRSAVGRNEFASDVVKFAYHNTGLQMAVGIITMFLLRDAYVHLRKVLSVYTLGVLATMILSTLLPALGAYPHLNMAATDAGFLSNAGTESYIAHFVALRDGSLREFPTTGWRGIVTFPSFHTIVTLTAAYAVFPIRWLYWPSALFAVVVMFATLPVGGHYTIDVVGGLVIFAASVAWVERRDRAPAAIIATRRVLQVNDHQAVATANANVNANANDRRPRSA